MKNTGGKKKINQSFLGDISKLVEENRAEYMDREDVFIKKAKKSYEFEYLPKNLGLHDFKDSAIKQITNFILSVILSKQAMTIYSLIIFGYLTYIGLIYFVCTGYPKKGYLCGNYQVHLDDFKTLALVIIGIIGGKFVQHTKKK
jgi:hypothetical protein